MNAPTRQITKAIVSFLVPLNIFVADDFQLMSSSLCCVGGGNTLAKSSVTTVTGQENASPTEQVTVLNRRSTEKNRFLPLSIFLTSRFVRDGEA